MGPYGPSCKALVSRGPLIWEPFAEAVLEPCHGLQAEEDEVQFYNEDWKFPGNSSYFWLSIALSSS